MDTLPSLYDVQLELARRDLSEYFELARGFKPAQHQKLILDELKEFLISCWSTPPGEHTKLRVLNINLPPGAGKALDVNCMLPGLNGYVRVEDVQPGDFVYSENGQLTRVVAKSDTWLLPAYEVTFDDGSSLVTNAEHLWTVRLKGNERRTVTLSTSELKSGYAIPLTAPVRFPKRYLPLDPYVLGVWLGDGTSESAQITTADPEILDEIQRRGFELGNARSAGDHATVRTIHGMSAALTFMKLYGEKRVPRQYLISSVEDRLDLLRGLMDSDGTIDKAGRCSFDNTNYRLVVSARKLCITLGIKVGSIKPKRAFLNGKECRESYRFNFTTDKSVFLLPRKAARLPQKLRGTTEWRYVREVNPVGERYTACIQVDNPTGLFLAGEDYVVTHNSSIISATLPAWVLGIRPTERIGIISAQGTLSALFENTIKADIENGDVFRDCFPQADRRPDKTRGWAKGTLYLRGLPRSEATPSLIAAGLFGSVLGRRFTMLILDDPQDQMTTRTPDQRQMSWNFLDATVLSRVIPGSPVICVQQRWHEDDVSGRLSRLYDAKVVKVKAIDDDGDSYWPAMYSREYLDQRRMAEPHMFQSNYQQEPGVGDGDIFKREWFRYYDLGSDEAFVVDEFNRFDPRKGWRYQSFDTAFKKGDENDYTAFVEGLVNPENNDVFITDFWWKRLEFPELVEAAKGAYTARMPRAVLIEDKASGTSLVQVLQRQSGVPLVAVKVETDKVNRARGTTGYLEAGKVFFPRNHPRVAEFEAFLTGFPFLTHDDPVDAFSQLMSYIITSGGRIDYGIG